MDVKENGNADRRAGQSNWGAHAHAPVLRGAGTHHAAALENGYRDYDEYLVERVLKIRRLLDSGVPTRIIRDMLPCLNDIGSTIVADPDPELRAMLVEQRDKLAERIVLLQQNRDALTRYIDAMDRVLCGA
ncbi:MerR family transcriptional regulator [Glutamicibacter sp. 2E12]|uniref:MerR family transcriptional regulator n=1 Tax=Glutamicibacter sp. 2E12 TaxID=3416181 RepID=UPI003CEAD184